MGRRRKPIDPSMHWKRGDQAIKQGLVRPLIAPDLSDADLAAANQAMDAAGFPEKDQRARSMVINALVLTKDYKTTPHLPYMSKKLTRATFGTARDLGNPCNTTLRLYLASQLFAAWHHVIEEKLSVSRKIVTGDIKTVRSPFVVFAQDIFAIIKIGKVEDNSTIYRAYERAVYSRDDYLITGPRDFFTYPIYDDGANNC